MTNAAVDGPSRSSSTEPDIDLVARRIAHLLPAQGPISVFIHHNPLHAFEHLPFVEAVAAASAALGCEPFLPEDRYRRELARGRITEADVDAVLAAEVGDEPIVDQTLTRRALWRRLVLHGVPEARGASLSWILQETPALARFRDDLPPDAREQLLDDGGDADAGEQAQPVAALWRAARAAVERAGAPAPAARPASPRPRDWLVAAGAPDIDDWVHPVLIRFTAAYLDQGLAHWPLADREAGIHRCFLRTYGSALARLCGKWARALPALIADERAAGRDARASVAYSLRALGVPGDQWEPLLTAEALALRGWAGMVRQLEERPDRVPAFAVPATLIDWLAVRLLLVRAAAAHAARVHLGHGGALAALRDAPRDPEPDDDERAWAVFHAAQLCGLDATALDGLAPAACASLVGEVARCDDVGRRRILHLAYERHSRRRFYDALAQHAPCPTATAPVFQAIFCIDEREESFRRHLEEVEPRAETFGAAGFFGVAMYYRGATDAHPRPLCPVAIRPQHYVAETHVEGSGGRARWRETRRRAGALVDKNVHLGSRTFVRGSVLMAALGVLWVVPLVLRVLFPWLRQRLARRDDGGGGRTQLHVARGHDPPPLGEYTGFTVGERARIVRGQLAPLGAVERLAPLVFVIGHGSTSLNNPHESAHDCGACGGGQGGPNARAFAAMANDPAVREALAAGGLRIPDETWFVGGQRNTASNAVTLFDEHLVPAPLSRALDRARRAFDEARAREAQERCRRFDNVPGWLPTRLALLHVEARSSDLAQPRPEYGHATNAFCVVGRRRRTRGLFMDRRAFLVSYDPASDADGAVLAALLAAVVPVVAGINLEYFFGFVDPVGYGSGTKLPHNVSCLLGVMDGASSDLRTGLPWQMLEVHEPVRLALVVEARVEVVQRVLRTDDRLRSLVERGWLYLACLDPDSARLLELDADGARAYAVDHPLKIVTGDSLAFCRGRRGPLPFVRLESGAAVEGRA